MTTELEQPTQDEINAFEMPFVPVGEKVLYYPQGFRTRDKRRRTVATVVATSHRNIEIVDPRGRLIEAVRHVEDPKLKLNADQREQGAWEHTEDYLRIQRLEERIERLEEANPHVLRDKPAEEHDQKRNDGFEKARKMLLEGRAVEYVHDRVKGYRIKKDEVRKLADELNQEE